MYDKIICFRYCYWEEKMYNIFVIQHSREQDLGLEMIIHYCSKPMSCLHYILKIN